MVSFELGKDIKKDVFRLVTLVGQRKNTESGIRNWTSNLRIPHPDVLPLSYKDSTMSDIYYEVYMTRVLHTAGISNVDCLNFENLTYFRWKALKHLEHSPRKKDTFTVYTFEGLQFIFYKDEFKEWLIKNLRRNVLSIGGMVFSNISNAKWKQKYGANSGPQISLRFQFSAKTV